MVGDTQLFTAILCTMASPLGGIGAMQKMPFEFCVPPKLLRITTAKFIAKISTLCWSGSLAGQKGIQERTYVFLSWHV